MQQKAATRRQRDCCPLRSVRAPGRSEHAHTKIKQITGPEQPEHRESGAGGCEQGSQAGSNAAEKHEVSSLDAQDADQRLSEPVARGMGHGAHDRRTRGQRDERPSSEVEKQEIDAHGDGACVATPNN